MPQYNRNDLEIAARNQHFTRDTFEKVLRLKTILDWMNVHEFLRAHLLLKGGTAINLTVFELPRLSVDIDMDFVPNLPREDMLQARETISGTIKAYMESEGYAFSPASRIHHSLDALHFTYTNAAGNQDMIKIELNYSLRAHLFEPMTRTFATDRYARTYGFFGGDRAVLLGAGRGGAAGGRSAGRPAPDGNAFPRPEGPEHTMPRRGVDPLDTARYILTARSAIEGKIY